MWKIVCVSISSCLLQTTREMLSRTELPCRVPDYYTSLECAGCSAVSRLLFLYSTFPVLSYALLHHDLRIYTAHVLENVDS